ncbi:OmpA family protein [Mesorhizobium camelthorni]|uniref:OmpA family protein n=2 Tax=Allomesorhizobium camelthorni TaxID=475069 RepID=A0A6G4W7V2_9HYPH|nr:OmpA family protein [Mesorhizobium camelthorni]
MPLHAGSPQNGPIAGHNTAPLILAQGEGSRGAEVLKKRRAERAEKKAREGSEEAGREAEKKGEQAERRREKVESDAARKREAEAGAAKKRQAEAAADRKRRASEEAARQAGKKQEQAERRREKAESDAARKREAEAGAAKKRQAEAAAERKRQASEEAARQAGKKQEQAEKRREKAESDAARKREAEAGAAKKRQAEAAADRKRRAESDAAEEAARRRQAESKEAPQRERRARRDREIIVEEPQGEEEPQRVRRAREAEERRIRERQAREQDDDRDEITESDGEIQERRAQRRLFDSAKERRKARRDRDVEVDEAEIRPLPRDDRDAQRETIAREVRPFIDEDGVRVERRERRRERRPEGAEILREMGDRLILQFGDQILVESDDRRRLSRGASEVYTEELRNGRTRETIIRPNGTRIVTIRNVYGDVIRRSRFTPDGYEQVLSYVDESDYDRLRDWRDPGLDLPPIRIDIPEEEYILDASDGYGADDYYAFLDQPPVEQVQRLYSVDEVKRSARVRDITRRVDLDTITFEFGSASIAESEIERLESLANAMDRMLKENPAEMFLIEGHTDAVGSNIANLALSDRRAEAVALALTDVFGLPPENLTTQGYGEEYLKIDTDEPERENRRVAVRRITPLVAPVASAD